VNGNGLLLPESHFRSGLCLDAIDSRGGRQLVYEYFASVSGEEDWSPRYNIAPTQPVPVIRQHPKELTGELSLLRWGLIPSWAKDSSVAAKMINARSETAGTKPAFREALKFRRCLIPADGFYSAEGGEGQAAVLL
jgi:putative SOS response-associated peptidase YedK